MPKPDGTIQRQIASPIKFSECQPEYRHIGGKLGANTGEVLQELGLTYQEISKLKKKAFLDNYG